MKKFAVIVAGGTGTRMGSALPKQFIELKGRPMIVHTLYAFINTFPDICIKLVLPEEFMEYAKRILDPIIRGKDVDIVTGGGTRFHSVQNGLNSIKGTGIVFIHDGARPLVTKELLLRCYTEAIEHGSAIPVIPVSESIRQVDTDKSKPVNRDTLRIVQTPQTFTTDIIIKAFKVDYSPEFTDEATVAEASGIIVHLVNGERRNIKVTTPEDLVVAAAIMDQL